MEIIRFSDLRPQPWRNGGGVTRELASHPRDASFQDGTWDWRVSIAEVSREGEFSTFPGMERVLTVVEGELFLLSVDGVEHPLEKYRPFRFSGDSPAYGSLPTGNVHNLNVFTRTGALKGYTSIIELSKKRAHHVFAGQLGILLQGQASVSEGPATAEDNTSAPDPAEQVALNRYDAVVGADARSPLILGRGFLAVVSVDPVDPVED